MRAIHYELSEVKRVDQRTAEIEATLEQGTVRQRLLIRCIDGEITHSDVIRLDESLNRKIPEGWLISDKRVSNHARKKATQDDVVQVFNLSEFLQQKVWGPYIDVLTSLVKRDQIPELYVDLACHKLDVSEDGKDINKDAYPSLDDYIDNWLNERGKMHISLLGEFGTGKTWFCRHYAHRQLERYLIDPANERLPLLITLRAFSKSMTPQQLINDALLEQYKLPFVGSAFDVFKEMNRRGKILLILDGFDEMAKQVVKQIVIDNFWELAKLVDDNSKVILTSRTEYFRWAKEAQSILSGEEYGRSTIILSPPKFEILYLEPFDDEKIEKVILGRMGRENGSIISKRILSIRNLAEMARKPVLIELLLASMGEISPDVLENQAQVYLYATNKLLLHNIKTERTFTSTADKLYFLCELAWEMINTGQLRIYYTQIPSRIQDYFGDRIKSPHELDNWDFDLRSQTLLHRDATGYYEFAHKSLAEYFVAFKFAANVGILSNTFANTYCEEDGNPCQILINKKDIKELSNDFGANPLISSKMNAINKFLKELMAKDSSKLLWDVISGTMKMDFEQAKYSGGNAAVLLSFLGESFENKDLSQTILAGADLKGCNLLSTNLNDCTLDRSDLRGAKFNELIGSAKIGPCTITLFLIADPRRIGSNWDLDRLKIISMPESRYHDLSRNLGIYNWIVNKIYPDEWGRLRITDNKFLFIVELVTTKLDILRIRSILLDQDSFESVAIYAEEIDTLKDSLTNDQIQWLESYKPTNDPIIQELIYEMIENF